MSRIGKNPIIIPADVKVEIHGQEVIIKGPKGELKQAVHPYVSVAQKDNSLLLTVKDPESKEQKAIWGLWGSLLKNMVLGVTNGYEKKLEVIGVGFKVNLQGNKLVLNVGYSHPVEYLLPKEISAQVEKNVITISGIDKQQVGEVAAQIRKIKKPEPYKGKGIKYFDEIIKKKAGKAAGKAA